MFPWIARLLLVFSGFIASWFVARNELHFPIVRMTITILLFTLFVAIIAFWPLIKEWIKKHLSTL